MQVVLDIHGWRKEIDADPLALRRGCIEIKIEPPIGLLVEPGDVGDYNKDFRAVMLYYCGRTENGMPLFGYEV